MILVVVMVASASKITQTTTSKSKNPARWAEQKNSHKMEKISHKNMAL